MILRPSVWALVCLCVLTRSGGGSALWSDALTGTQQCGRASPEQTERRRSTSPCWLSPALPDRTHTNTHRDVVTY